jgi:hypothetical protein
MSALGQKQTCAVQNVMSALPTIATEKADIRTNARARLVKKTVVQRLVQPLLRLMSEASRRVKAAHAGLFRRLAAVAQIQTAKFLIIR